MPPRRPHFTSQEIDSQLQHIYLSSDFLGSQTESLEHLGPVIRNVEASRQHEAYLSHLQSFITGKENEIEQLCKANYQDFVASTDKLLKIRQGTINLRHRIGELNEDIQDKGGDVASKKRELLESRRVAANVDSAIVTLQACLRILDLYAKVQQLINDGHYFSALHYLQDLQNHHLRQLLHLPLASHILSKIPSTCQQIRTAITKQFKSWLFEARQESCAVGRLALKITEERAKRWKRVVARDNLALSRYAHLGSPLEIGVCERVDHNPFDSKHVNINFHSLYNCIHIYDTLGAREELQSSYQQDRRAQAHLVLAQVTDVLTNLRQLCEEIVGFFIIETHVFRTAGDFRSKNNVNQLWDEVCDKTVQIILEALLKCKDPDLLLTVKENLIFLAHTLETYDYVVEPLHSLVLSTADRYVDILQVSTKGELESAILDDDNQTMVVNSPQDMSKVLNVVWLPEAGEWSFNGVQSQPLPCALPFSQMYPLCCMDLKNIIESYIAFSEDIVGKPRLRLSESLQKTLNNLLQTHICEVIHTRARGISNISQLSQMIMNLLYLYHAIDGMEVWIKEITSSQSEKALDQARMTVDSKVNAIKECIVESIAGKLDEFMEQANYDWATRQKPKSLTDGSDYLVDLSGYLTLVVNSILIQLPSNIRNNIHQGVLKHVSQRLLSFLTNPNVRAISEQGLAHFAVDVNYIRGQSALVDGSSEDDDSFEELSQLITLLQSDTYMDFIDRDLRQMAYPAVDKKVLQIALVKLITYWNSIAPDSPYVNAKRKKASEDLLKAISR